MIEPNLLADEETPLDTALQDVKSKRTSRCPGCKVSHDDHHWGLPGPHCQGSSEASFQLLSSNSGGKSSMGEKTQVSEVKATSKSVVAIDRQTLLARLDAIALEEQELAELEEFRASVLEKEAALAKKRQLLSTGAVAMATASGIHQQQQRQSASEGLFTLKDLRKQQQSGTSSQSPLAAPLDHLLGLQPTTEGSHHPGFTWQEQLREQQLHSASATSQSLQAQFHANESRHADMFLAPKAVPQGEKILRIVDFIPSIVPQETEEVLSHMGHSRLVLSYGQQRPRLSSVSWQQWVIANTCIFHALLFSSKLPTTQDIRDYLAYTVKVMELAGKYEWVSVLKYDNEYRQLQATYNFPWSYDSPHLHELVLVPRAKAKALATPQAKPG